MSATPLSINLANPQSKQDIATFCKRLGSLDPQSAVRILARGKTVALIAATLYPQTLLDTVPTVLGMRGMALAQESSIDVVVPATALGKSAAEAEQSSAEIIIPETVVNAVWSGVLPPLSGWQRIGSISAAEVRKAAKHGMEAVERALPQNPGHAVLDTVRSRIWSSPLETSHAQLDDLKLPGAIGLTAEVLGLLPQKETGELALYRANKWIRMSAPQGYILIKN